MVMRVSTTAVPSIHQKVGQDIHTRSRNSKSKMPTMGAATSSMGENITDITSVAMTTFPTILKKFNKSDIVSVGNGLQRLKLP